MAATAIATAIAISEHRSFLTSVLARQKRRRIEIDPAREWPTPPKLATSSRHRDTTVNVGEEDEEENVDKQVVGPSSSSRSIVRRLPPTIDYASKSNVVNYVTEEESVRNDYADWYGVSGEWGSNYVLGAEDERICEEFPALRRLMDLKAQLVDSTSHPPLYVPFTLPGSSLTATSSISGNINSNSSSITQIVSPHRFDVILITPPATMSWERIAALPLRSLSADPGFVFLWVGDSSGDGLERGRETFAKWGFRRAEDIVWVKTNKAKEAEGPSGQPEGTAESLEEDSNENLNPKNGHDAQASWSGRKQGGLFAGQKEHCLMGIRGTVRRSTDGRFVHCNVDTDIMLWEDDGNPDGLRHPPYLQTLIENFCLGTRRLHLFGSPRTARRGWVTAGEEDLSESLPSSTKAGTTTTVGDSEYTSADMDDEILEEQPGGPHDPEPVRPNQEAASSATVDKTKVELFDSGRYTGMICRAEDGRPILPLQPEIDNLRPKSPVRKGRKLPGTGAGTGPGQGQGQHQLQHQQRPHQSQYAQHQQQGPRFGNAAPHPHSHPQLRIHPGSATSSSLSRDDTNFNNFNSPNQYSASIHTSTSAPLATPTPGSQGSFGMGTGGDIMRFGQNVAMASPMGVMGEAHFQMQQHQQHQQQQFDPAFLQAQAQAQAQAQQMMQMQMMMQMQVQMQAQAQAQAQAQMQMQAQMQNMGMGMGMGIGMGAGVGMGSGIDMGMGIGMGNMYPDQNAFGNVYAGGGQGYFLGQEQGQAHGQGQGGQGQGQGQGQRLGPGAGGGNWNTGGRGQEYDDAGDGWQSYE